MALVGGQVITGHKDEWARNLGNPSVGNVVGVLDRVAVVTGSLASLDLQEDELLGRDGLVGAKRQWGGGAEWVATTDGEIGLMALVGGQVTTGHKDE